MHRVRDKDFFFLPVLMAGAAGRLRPCLPLLRHGDGPAKDPGTGTTASPATPSSIKQQAELYRLWVQVHHEYQYLSVVEVT